MGEKARNSARGWDREGGKVRHGDRVRNRDGTKVKGQG